MKLLSDALQNLPSFEGVRSSYEELLSKVYADPEIKNFLKEHHVTNEERDHSAAKLYEFFNEKNKINNGSKSLVPGYIPELIWNNHLIDITYKPSKKTKANHDQMQQKNRFHAFAMPKNFENDTFNNFYTSNSNRVHLLLTATKFVEHYCNDKDNFYPGMYIYGKFGVGKTYLLIAIANALVTNKINVAIVHFPSFAVELKNSIHDNTVGNKIDFIKKIPVLFLDDIGADAMSPWIRDDVLGIILEYRMQNRLSTFFSANFSMNDLESDHLKTDNHGDNDELKAKRLMQRIRFLSREYQLDGINNRLSK